ncbi:antibiotic biosynthesis monooxygenase [Mesorhizobium microcysteis]|uniref:Antibiotic biosynthesis monooxygenase n=1 Tax=Neoaquamicrobium microcysteis TaxID=2682781 RepID=A0A5D4GXV3_9HYPH|nr:putative quinol monooxygenase [Mesorhizobium microcysteis]TYR33097.1 antibiotic biosynthesis monooxygenase [Mesorhizobium microcysteis]
MIYVVATLTIKPGSLEALRAPAAACVAETRKEKGCISYELFASLDDPEKLVFVERWETREDLTAHSKQPHLVAWRDASAPHLVERRIEIVHPERIEQF